MTEKPHSVPPEIEGALVELGSDPEASVSIREADEVRDYIERLEEQLEAVRGAAEWEQEHGGCFCRTCNEVVGASSPASTPDAPKVGTDA